MTTDTVRDAPLASAQQAAEQIREFATGTSRAMGQLALDTYEQTMTTLVEFEQKAAEAVPFDWAKTLIGTHASVVSELTDAYVKAARAVLA